MYPDEPMAEAMRAALEPHARKLKKRLRKAGRGDPDGIHGARTTIRRLREGLVAMGRTVFEPDCVAALEDGLQGLQRSLGPARDDDVLLDDVRRWMKRASRARRSAMAPLEKRLRRRRRKHARALADDLSRKRERGAVKAVRSFLRGRPRAVLPPPKNPAHAVPTLVRHFIADETWRAYEEVLAFETHTASPDFAVIHKVRSACRRLRYLLELFEGAVPPGTAEVADALRKLQDRLGDLHDHVVAVGLLEQWIAEGRIPVNDATNEYLKHRRRTRDRMRAEFDEEWRRLTGPAFRHAIAIIASGEMRSRPDGSVRLVGASSRAGNSPGV
ncbi:MAG TPA: CHAD domain-containing protein [Polyangiaceae bacterium]